MLYYIKENECMNKVGVIMSESEKHRRKSECEKNCDMIVLNFVRIGVYLL